MNLKNVKIIYPSLFQTEIYNGEDTGKYTCTFLLHKDDHASEIAEIQEEIQRRYVDLKVKKLPDDKVCLKDGDDSDKEIFINHYYIKSSSKRRPLVINREKEPITQEDNLIYGGCYVNAIIDFWNQDNAYGKRINSNLSGVQFVAHGDPIGDVGASVDDFDAFD